MPSDIAVYGLGVMGRNLALNLADQGLGVSVFNRTASVTRDLLSGLASDSGLHPAYDIQTLVASLRTPRVILIMATAGRVIDQVIEGLLPHLSAGDILIDGGNSHFGDSERRWRELAARGIRFVGCGVSGGEHGARHGPSMMPGGDQAAWPHVRGILQRVAARADDGEPCCRWIGDGGAGHYVKMVHNGIEYGDMQLIAEAWQLMRDGLGLSADAIADTFASWNQGVLSSYLIEITADILRVSEPDGSLRVDHILDAAGQKGTGRWTAIDALEVGVPLTLITEAVHARALSALKDERVAAARHIGSDRPPPADDRDTLIDAIHDALYAAKIISYTQGFQQLRAAAEAYGWRLVYRDIARIWRAGCIIRSRFLDDIAQAFDRDPELPSLLFDDFFASALRNADAGWRRAVGLGVDHAIPVPALSAALSFYDGYRSATGAANLLQAQRDYFGAHTYYRVDRDPSARWHTRWDTDQGEERIDE